MWGTDSSLFREKCCIYGITLSCRLPCPRLGFWAGPCIFLFNLSHGVPFIFCCGGVSRLVFRIFFFEKIVSYVVVDLFAFVEKVSSGFYMPPSILNFHSLYIFNLLLLFNQFIGSMYIIYYVLCINDSAICLPCDAANKRHLYLFPSEKN